MIVFLHGWGMSKTIFTQFTDTYLKEKDVLLLDLPGYGGDKWVDDFDSQVEQLLASIPKGAHLVAWSLAGLYALRLAKLYPAHLSKLTMIASTPCFVKKGNFENALDHGLLNQFSQQLVKDREKTIERFLLLQLHGQIKAKEYARAIKEEVLSDSKVETVVLKFGLEALKNIDCRDDLRSCNVPIQFVIGERDMIVPVRMAEDIRKINPQISVTIIKKAGHLLFITHKKIFYEAVFG